MDRSHSNTGSRSINASSLPTNKDFKIIFPSHTKESIVEAINKLYTIESLDKPQKQDEIVKAIKYVGKTLDGINTLYKQINGMLKNSTKEEKEYVAELFKIAYIELEKEAKEGEQNRPLQLFRVNAFPANSQFGKPPIGGGKATYNGKEYKVRMGPRGGKFILVGKEKTKVYIS